MVLIYSPDPAVKKWVLNRVPIAYALVFVHAQLQLGNL